MTLPPDTDQPSYREERYMPPPFPPVAVLLVNRLSIEATAAPFTKTPPPSEPMFESIERDCKVISAAPLSIKLLPL